MERDTPHTYNLKEDGSKITHSQSLMMNVGPDDHNGNNNKIITDNSISFLTHQNIDSERASTDH
eukprot:3310985-Ditylum_brightwellii.AAC.1